MCMWLTRTFLGLLLILSPWMASTNSFASLSAEAAVNPPSRQVLVLHSYHSGLAWTDSIMRGISNILLNAELKVLLHVEYLDVKRNVSPEYFSRIDDLLQYKLVGSDFDLIIVSDNDALNFVLRHRDTLFAGVPVVFCGVNSFQPSMLAGLSEITGIAEVPSFYITTELALRLHPATKEIVILGETKSVTGQANNQALIDISQRFQKNVLFIFWNDIPISELQKRLATLSPSQIVLLSSALTDDRGTVFSFVESCRMVREACPVPLYGFWDFFLGQGIVGGKLVSGISQGELAAQQGLRILQGEDPNTIPVISNEANVPMFDDLELQRFGISLADLPEGSVVINRLPSFYPVNKRDFWVVIGLLVILLILTQLLLLSNYRRKKIEKAFRKSEERLRLALEGSQDGMWDWNALTGRNLVDERWCTMLGYTKDEIADHIDQWQTRVHADDLPVITRIQQQCMDGKISHFAGEFRMRTKSGDWKWILGRGTVTERDGNGRTLRLTGTHKDISQQKATEQALKSALGEAENARDKINAILRSIADALIVTDNEGRIILMNPLAERLFGSRFEAVSGEDVRSLVDSPIFQSNLAAALAGENDSPAEDLELYHPELKEVRVFHLRPFPVLTQENERAGVVAILQDVTKSREMDRMKSEFISTAAHELRTPLSIILGFSELILSHQEFTEEQKREFLQVIMQKAEGLAALVNELLDMSRMESGGMIALNPVRCSMADIVLPLVNQYRKIYPGYHFEAELAPAPVDLNIDSGKIGQVLENLLSNAVKYSPGGGTIRLAVGYDADVCRVTVADKGIGMTAQQVDKVFDKFYRADFANTAIGGLGLGMAIVRNIVEAHGGTIRVDSELGQGTTVAFTLPLVD